MAQQFASSSCLEIRPYEDQKEHDQCAHNIRYPGVALSSLLRSFRSSSALISIYFEDKPLIVIKLFTFKLDTLSLAKNSARFTVPMV